MYISENIKYAGVNDYKIDLFEGQYKVPAGISYNSYIITGEKIAVMDTVGEDFGREWLDNINKITDGKTPDYLVILHMEPDHSANIDLFMKQYPQAVIVSSRGAFNMMKGYFGTDYRDRRIVVKEGGALDLGGAVLTFVAAPFVHWPEVMFAYESGEKVLFSADGFGTFATADSHDGWPDEARRYYINIVGKFGDKVQAVLKKAAALDIEKICPLHGPVLTENLGYYIDLYDKWSSYTPEESGVVIAFNSVYGHTKQAAEMLFEKATEKGIKAEIYDLARSDMSQVVARAFRFDKLVLAGTTYNGELYPVMREFINELTERNFKNRKVAIIENGTWAPMVAKKITAALAECRGIAICETKIALKGGIGADTPATVEKLAEELK